MLFCSTTGQQKGYPVAVPHGTLKITIGVEGEMHPLETPSRN